MHNEMKKKKTNKIIYWRLTQKKNVQDGDVDES